MNLLDTIVQSKKQEIAYLKTHFSNRFFEEQPLFNSATRSLKKSIENSVTGGIIAEFKRQSPSKGVIHAHADVEAITTGYTAGLVAGISVLTDAPFFGAQPNDFAVARANNPIPLLRKDFILDEIQLWESKAMGADAILLIARILSGEALERLTAEAHQLGLEVLLELHQEEELEKINPELVDMVGINNRNLNSFEVALHHSIALGKKIPENCLKIAESGIDAEETLRYLQQHGFHGFLIGEQFMKQENPGEYCQQFIHNLR